MGRYKFKKRKFPPDFKKVVEHIRETKGIDVELGHLTKFDGFFSRLITIHHNYDLKRNGLYVLLKECGHVLQPTTNIGINEYKKLNSKTNPTEYKMGEFLKELDAWESGYKLAKNLGIQINKEEWENEKNKSLIEYFKK